ASQGTEPPPARFSTQIRILGHVSLAQPQSTLSPRHDHRSAADHRAYPGVMMYQYGMGSWAARETGSQWKHVRRLIC
ncbi:MAG TPA: hypothetical protein VFV93_08855, partial [Thermomicrobiales bacterium]|nr:hypothetical protein [Thermomicrobiales bacterium]